MKTAAIIAEYNPFHNGHAYQIEQIKKILPEKTAVIAVMSGSLVQRGELALISKYERARAAVMCGVDAVFELPSVYSCAPANLFAAAAVHIISALGEVDYLCFGSETADIELLYSAAEKSGDIELGGVYRDKSYPAGFYEAFKDLYGEKQARVFKGSNDILGVEYICALKKTNSGITPLAVKRMGSDYITSAGAIRERIYNRDFSGLKNFMPEKSFEILESLFENGKIADIENISAAVISHINRLDTDEIARFAEVRGGFEFKIKKICENSFDYGSLITNLASKHLTNSQTRRMVLNIFFGITRGEQKKTPEFTNLLCINGAGQEYLNKIKKTAKIKIISRPADFMQEPEFCRNIFIDNIYKLAYQNKSGEICAVKEKPVIL
ncbi:MAG: nucleotidyltransferase family protein [Oscillospiraceae bacterium]|nr:nucleotidyltransferase family protein [Oscillospiraceae bacterium]